MAYRSDNILEYSKWTNEKIEREIRLICDAIGLFPSRTDLVNMGRNDLAVQISRRGGFVFWSKSVGVPRKHSDSDTGWMGEKSFGNILESYGLVVEKPIGVKSPFDRLVDGVLRVDVKTAKYAEYPRKGNKSGGWYYRIGKYPQSDLVVLYQLDTREFYAIPYWECTRSNMTISKSGGRYSKYRNNIDLVRTMCNVRKQEREMLA